MSNTELVQAGLKAWEADDTNALSPLVADDFVMTGPTPQPLSKADFIGLMHVMLAAFPDFAFNVSQYKEDGDTVVAYAHITGTQTGTLTLPGFPPIPPTGKKIALPQEIQTYTIKNGQLQSLVTDGSPDSGVPGMLLQLGISLPQ